MARKPITVIWLGLTALVFVAAFLKAPPFPTNDPALFEYYGRHLLHGQRLYVDLWDNKLPSIYLVNEFWQWLFGAQYRWHLVLETIVNAGSVSLFSLLLRRHRLASWPWATFCFAAILLLPPAAYDYTEYYALPLILGALLLDLPLLSGACIALAASFWLPSLLVGVVICWRLRRGSRLASFVAGLLAVAIPYAIAFIAIMSPGVVTALAASWPAYIAHGSSSLTGSRLGFVYAYAAPIVISGAGAAIAAFLTVVRRPNRADQRLALGWIVATLIGAFLPGNPSFHHFVPSLAALVFGIALFTRQPFDRLGLPLRALAACAAIVLLAGTAKSTLDVARTTAGLARSAQTIGACIDRAFGVDTTVEVAEFAPELYLAADAAPGNRFAMIDPMLHMTQRSGANIRPPSVFIGLAEDRAPTGYQLRYVAAPWWRVYTKPDAVWTCP